MGGSKKYPYTEDIGNSWRGGGDPFSNILLKGYEYFLVPHNTTMPPLIPSLSADPQLYVTSQGSVIYSITHLALLFCLFRKTKIFWCVSNYSVLGCWVMPLKKSKTIIFLYSIVHITIICELP